ncbi:MAG: sigma-54-dependent Fis family transcriptional regulator [Candidatus Koribacter versatilis]|uniref:Sigma-54-dependent Fis family transcriptional regulator n=1 Tax=Candidatus Korobacter versatilis TaxID=658062 RepID=A0A932EQA7_9BACT|nr:sigma-54-dependent Fis family transcriptional regulator [Candidatus Koribacter versatilis]
MTEDFRIRFLIVDDQQSIRKLCMTIGASLGFVCAEAESAEDALVYLEASAADIVLVDLKMANMGGLEVLGTLKKMLPRTEVAIMTGYGSVETAVQAMRLGAYDYITKPFRVEEMKLVLQRMAEKVRLVAENQFLLEQVRTQMELNGIVGSSARIQDVLRMVARLKDTRTPVLITGESGTGKELVARAIHFGGVYAKRPFVAVDCGSLVPTLIESELFGYEKGAFTGAVRTKAGLFQHADGGTIFLDEIGELPMEMQAKLLRVLQEKEVRPVGSNQKVRVDVRVLAATNRDLEAAYKAGTFRKDLYFRLNVVTLHLAALRERKSDIPTLVRWFLGRIAPNRGLQVSNAAMNCLLNYEWPGNVRELENCIERAVALGGDAMVIDVDDLPPSIQGAATIGPGARVPAISAGVSNAAEGEPSMDLVAMERATIQRVFDQVGGDKTLARQILGISRATLYRKIKLYNIRIGQQAAAVSSTS